MTESSGISPDRLSGSSWTAVRFLARVKTREAGTCPLVLAVARIETPSVGSDPAITAWLVGEERARFERLRVDGARADFLAGRVAAKLALAALGGAGIPEAQRIEIRRGCWHQPCVIGAGDAAAVTLAHSGGLAVAVAFDERLRCGVDIERRRRPVGDVVRHETTADETAWAEAGGVGEAETRWLLLWTAREAIGKCLGVGLLLSGRALATRDWRPSGDGWRAAAREAGPLGIRSLETPQWVASLAVPEEVVDQPAFVAVCRALGRELSGARR